jgi:DNA-binding transcriptional LysR family regulator
MKTNAKDYLSAAQQFFTAYDAHDVDGMIALCADSALGQYAPYGRESVVAIRGGEKQPNAELQLQPDASLAQLEAVRAGRLDAGFVNFMPESDPELDQLLVALQHIELAAPKRHPLTRLKKHRLRDLRMPHLFGFLGGRTLYDRMMLECYRGGLKSPHIVQEGVNEPTILSLVSTGMGVGWVLATARWRCPESVVILPVVDLNMPLTLALVWRKDNASRLLANFICEVRRFPEVRAVNKPAAFSIR